jgi:large subunit ribosomal protein L25
MENRFELEAEIRTKAGTSVSRTLRRANKVPAVLYGGDASPVLLALDHNKLVKQLDDEAVYSHVLRVRFNGQEERAILKDLQRHPSKAAILHMDLQRVSETEKIRVHVPLHFVGEDASVGVKKGGIVTHNLVNVEITCLPDALPEYLEVDLAGLDIGESIHLSQLSVPEGVEIPALAQGTEQDVTVVAIHARQSEALDETEEAEAGEVSDEGEAAD